jgi:uncharacterized protein YlxW (UPF0749 family)
MTSAPGSSPRWRRLLRPRLRRADLVVALLLGVLGFATAVQIRSVQDEGPLAGARQEDLVQILDDLSNRNDRLLAEIAMLTEAQGRLTGGTDRSEAALQEARRRAQVLGVLAGTVPARGPGVRLTVTDPDLMIGSDVLLDALVELRDAGAEAIQLEGPVDLSGRSDQQPAQVRVVASTAVEDGSGGSVVAGGVELRPPYRFVVVGEPSTLAAALAIPGGVVDTVELRGGRALVERRDEVLVDALRPVDPPRYARPASPPGS